MNASVLPVVQLTDYKTRLEDDLATANAAGNAADVARLTAEIAVVDREIADVNTAAAGTGGTGSAGASAGRSANARARSQSHLISASSSSPSAPTPSLAQDQKDKLELRRQKEDELYERPKNSQEELAQIRARRKGQDPYKGEIVGMKVPRKRGSAGMGALSLCMD
jgi:hypothetical protein